MKIQDSGDRREFQSGAVRDMSEGKGRADLLPLAEVAVLMEDTIISRIASYITTGETAFLYFACTVFINESGNDFPTAILELSKHYEEGAKKYVERNWEKGIPLHCYIDSGVRHYLKWLRGDNDEPHDRAFLWNMLGAIWTQNNLPEMIDLPFKEKNNEDKEV